MANPRSQSRTERWRREVLALHGPTCRMPHCVMPSRRIDLTLKAPARGSYAPDHVTPIILGGAPFDVRNGRPAHLACNASAGAALGNRLRARRRLVVDGREKIQVPGRKTDRKSVV